ncbi:RNA recognition motif domain-containing protein [Ditylenchus destructor]|uniref:RNA recognition motif domain-containing protein n=1 Tax=Ditylenchus destructor TaxID=166010 RepID=A0AAD4NK21_9BILA|nr:RNA recognition motif domain-containing protein [Ditylenchus destructor]
MWAVGEKKGLIMDDFNKSGFLLATFPMPPGQPYTIVTTFHGARFIAGSPSALKSEGVQDVSTHLLDVNNDIGSPTKKVPRTPSLPTRTLSDALAETTTASSAQASNLHQHEPTVTGSQSAANKMTIKQEVPEEDDILIMDMDQAESMNEPAPQGQNTEQQNQNVVMSQNSDDKTAPIADQSPQQVNTEIRDNGANLSINVESRQSEPANVRATSRNILEKSPIENAGSKNTNNSVSGANDGDSSIVAEDATQLTFTSTNENESLKTSDPTSSTPLTSVTETQPSDSAPTTLTTAQKLSQQKDTAAELAASMWISGISNTTKAADLKAIFSKFGKVITAKIFTTKNKLSPNCFGYITMGDVASADICMQKLNRTNVKGKVITVEKANRSRLPPITKPAAGLKPPTIAPSLTTNSAGSTASDKKDTLQLPSGTNQSETFDSTSPEIIIESVKSANVSAAKSNSAKTAATTKTEEQTSKSRMISTKPTNGSSRKVAPLPQGGNASTISRKISTTSGINRTTSSPGFGNAGFGTTTAAATNKYVRTSSYKVSGSGARVRRIGAISRVSATSALQRYSSTSRNGRTGLLHRITTTGGTIQRRYAPTKYITTTTTNALRPTRGRTSRGESGNRDIRRPTDHRVSSTTADHRSEARSRPVDRMPSSSRSGYREKSPMRRGHSRDKSPGRKAHSRDRDHHSSRDAKMPSWEREEMFKLMRKKEDEYRKKEEELKLQREKEKMRFERERLEREKLEVQQMKLTAQLANAQLALMANVQPGGAQQNNTSSAAAALANALPPNMLAALPNLTSGSMELDSSTRNEHRRESGRKSVERGSKSGRVEYSSERGNNRNDLRSNSVLKTSTYDGKRRNRSRTRSPSSLKRLQRSPQQRSHRDRDNKTTSGQYSSGLIRGGYGSISFPSGDHSRSGVVSGHSDIYQQQANPFVKPSNQRGGAAKSDYRESERHRSSTRGASREKSGRYPSSSHRSPTRGQPISGNGGHNDRSGGSHHASTRQQETQSFLVSGLSSSGGGGTASLMESLVTNPNSAQFRTDPSYASRVAAGMSLSGTGTGRSTDGLFGSVMSGNIPFGTRNESGNYASSSYRDTLPSTYQNSLSGDANQWSTIPTSSSNVSSNWTSTNIPGGTTFWSHNAGGRSTDWEAFNQQQHPQPSSRYNGGSGNYSGKNSSSYSRR